MYRKATQGDKIYPFAVFSEILLQFMRYQKQSILRRFHAGEHPKAYKFMNNKLKDKTLTLRNAWLFHALAIAVASTYFPSSIPLQRSKR